MANRNEDLEAHDRYIADAIVAARSPGGRIVVLTTAYEAARRLALLVPGTPPVADLFRRADSYVDKILKGSKLGELPIEQPTTFEFVFNMKSANALGIKIPNSILLRADYILQ